MKSFKLGGGGPGSVSVSAQSEESGEIVMFPSIYAVLSDLKTKVLVVTLQLL